MAEQLALFDKAPYYDPPTVSITIDSLFSDYKLVMTEYLTDLYQRYQESETEVHEEEFLDQVMYYLSDDILADIHITDWEVKGSGRL